MPGCRKILLVLVLTVLLPVLAACAATATSTRTDCTLGVFLPDEKDLTVVSKATLTCSSKSDAESATDVIVKVEQFDGKNRHEKGRSTNLPDTSYPLEHPKGKAPPPLTWTAVAICEPGVYRTWGHLKLLFSSGVETLEKPGPDVTLTCDCPC